MSVQRYSVRKINLMPLAKFGFVLGGVALFLPSLVCAWSSTQLLVILRNWLETWQSSSQIDLGLLDLPGFDFVTLLGLTETQALLVRLSDQPLAVALLIIVSMVIGGGLLAGLSILLVGWGYNLLAFLTGGLEIELQTR